jgi:hypothetical protein
MRHFLLFSSICKFCWNDSSSSGSSPKQGGDISPGRRRIGPVNLRSPISSAVSTRAASSYILSESCTRRNCAPRECPARPRMSELRHSTKSIRRNSVDGGTRCYSVRLEALPARARRAFSFLTTHQSRCIISRAEVLTGKPASHWREPRWLTSVSSHPRLLIIPPCG